VTALLNHSTLDLGWELAWLTVALIFGCLAGSVIGRGGYGKVGDGLILIGALADGLLLEFFSTNVAWLEGGLIVAFLSACVFIGLQHLTSARKTLPTGLLPQRATAPIHVVPVLRATR
jgi:uncharacterized membrane protein YeaQ/YmgE (transglycosylase-associated protein family)